MEVYITKGKYKIACDICTKRVPISEVKKIKGKFYCSNCQKELLETLNDTNDEYTC